MTPEHDSIPVGSIASFTCHTNDRPKWFHGSLQTYPISYDKVLTFAVQNGDEGLYYCLGDYGFGQSYFIAVSTLAISGKN